MAEPKDPSDDGASDEPTEVEPAPSEAEASTASETVATVATRTESTTKSEGKTKTEVVELRTEVKTVGHGSRKRSVFLWVSAIALTLVLIASAEVLLPFILGLVVAFIFLPGVLFVERRGVPRWVAILLVYAVALGAIAGFFAVVIPTIVGEVKVLQKDMPSRIQYIKEHWLPEVDRKLNEWSGKMNSPSKATEAAEPEAAANATDPDGSVAPAGSTAPTNPNAPDAVSSAKPEDDAKPSIIIEPRADGSYAVTLDKQVQLRRVNDEVWRLEPEERNKGDEKISTTKLVEKALDKGAKYLAENTGEIFKFGQAIVGAVWKSVFTLFMTLMLGGYMMLTHEKIFRFFRDLVRPESQPAYDRFLHRLERGLAGVVRGQLLICVVNGVLSAIGFWIFGLKYWPIMALLAGVGSIIPIFGSIFATIPAVAVGLTQSPTIAIAVLLWVIGIHQIEANLLNPKIIGDQAKIHPVLVVFSLIVGEHFFQIKGALFAVPCLSIIQTIFLHFRETTLGLADPLATQAPTNKKRSWLSRFTTKKPS